MQIWPSDLEDLIKCHPDVVDVGVIGVPNPPDDLPKAFVVKKEGVKLTEDDIVSFVKGMFSKIKDCTTSEKIGILQKIFLSRV